MEPEASPGLGDIISAVKRRRHLVVGMGLPILLVAAVLALALPDVYRASATFSLVEEQKDDSFADRNVYDDQYVYTLRDRVLRSPQLIDIVKELTPYPDLVDQPEKALSHLKGDVGVDMATEAILDPGSGRERDVFKGFTVSYDNRSAERALSVAERVSELFTEISRSSDLDRANHSIQFFANEADQTRKQIAEQEQRLADFKERNFDKLPEVAQANVNFRAQIERQLEDVDRELRGVRQNRVFLVQQLQQEQSGPAVGNLRQLEDEYARKSATYAPDHPDIVTLRRQIENLKRSGPGVSGSSLQAELDAQRAALAEARQRYSDDHPDVRRLVRNVQALEARLASGESPTTSRAAPTVVSVQLQTQLNAIDTQIDGLQTRSAQLRNQLLNLDMKLGSAPEIEREYQAITRDLDTARQAYDQLINRRMGAELQAAAVNSGAADKFQVLDRPSLPLKPAAPGRLKIVILGLILAFIVAFGAAAAAEVLDSRVRGSRDIRNVLQVTPLAVVPAIHNSVYARAHAWRLAAATVSVAIGAPLLYLLVKLLTA